MIPIHVSNQKAYVWSIDDITSLRERHRICGVLTGTLAQLSQQNIFLGLPLVLMEEEVVLLLEEGFAFLIDDPNAHLQPNQDVAFEWNKRSKQQASLTGTSTPGQQEPTKEKHALSETALAKRAARQRKREADNHLDNSLLNSINSNSHQSVEEPDLRFPVIRPSSELPWYRPKEQVYSSLEAASKAGIWAYPSTSFQRARCDVFKYIWSQGNFLGTGIKFGGDFLVYPGDPLRYHSHFVASVHFKSGELSPMEIVAHGRLGTGTRKNHLICSWDEKSREVECFSIEWSGFG